MKDRIVKLIDAEQLTSSKFADTIGVQRSSISHLLSGRNKPSFDFLQKTLASFPYIHAEWLLTGEGEMYKENSAAGPLFGQDVQNSHVPDLPASSDNVTELPPVTDLPAASISEKVAESSTIGDLASGSHSTGQSRKLLKVILLYDDSSFESYLQQG